MDRNEEYRSLLEELEETPIQLEYTMQRVEARLGERRKRKFWAIPASSVLLLLTVFTFLVNTIPTFAYTCGQIPILKELTKAVALSPSLLAAVENQYVQPIKQEQTHEGVTARIEYVIVDQKQLNIFYSLESSRWGELDIEPKITKLDGTNLEGYGMSVGSYGEPNGELNSIVIDFVDRDMPEGIRIALNVEVRSLLSEVKEKGLIVRPPVRTDEEVAEMIKYKGKKLGEFAFDLYFDPLYTAQGENIVLDKPFILDEEELILEEVSIYPTHINISFDDVDTNTAWLRSLDFYIENEKGKRFEKISNGISASGKEGSPMMASHRLESSFFSESEALTMYITGVDWLDKDKTKVKLDLKNLEAEWLLEGVTFESAEKIGRDWTLTFYVPQYEEGHFYQIWAYDYYDEIGNEYSINSYSSTSTSYYDEEQKKVVDIPDLFGVRVYLEDYPYDTVYMSPNFTRRVELREPVVIKIK